MGDPGGTRAGPGRDPGRTRAGPGRDPDPHGSWTASRRHPKATLYAAGAARSHFPTSRVAHLCFAHRAQGTERGVGPSPSASLRPQRSADPRTKARCDGADGSHTTRAGQKRGRCARLTCRVCALEGAQERHRAKACALSAPRNPQANPAGAVLHQAQPRWGARCHFQAVFIWAVVSGQPLGNLWATPLL